jgi:hypothetical protein
MVSTRRVQSSTEKVSSGLLRTLQRSFGGFCEPPPFPVDGRTEARFSLLIWPDRRNRFNYHGFIAAAKRNWWYGDFATGIQLRQ